MPNKTRKPFNANGGRGRFEVRAEAGSEEATIYLYDVIGEDWYGGVKAIDFIKALNDITAGTIHLRINSPGGDVFEARAMQTALREYPARVIAHIDGVAASAATFLSLGCDEVEMAEGAFFMIHNAWCFAAGNAEEMRKRAGWLDKIDASICADYVQKTGKKEEEICTMMAAETWMTAEEAKENGFVDRISEPKKAENCWNLDACSKVPDALKVKNEPKPEPEKPEYDRAEMERRLALIELG